jgi:hypothetical protein
VEGNRGEKLTLARKDNFTELLRWVCNPKVTKTGALGCIIGSVKASFIMGVGDNSGGYFKDKRYF